MDRHSSYTAPRSGRMPASGSTRRSPKRGNSGRPGNENRFLHNFLCYILPFIVFNVILYFLVTSSPRIEMTIGDTSDYKTVSSPPLWNLRTLNFRRKTAFITRL